MPWYQTYDNQHNAVLSAADLCEVYGECHNQAHYGECHFFYLNKRLVLINLLTLSSFN